MRYLQNNKEKGSKNFFMIAVWLSVAIIFFYFFRQDIIRITSSSFISVSAPIWKAEELLSDNIASLLILASDKEKISLLNESLKNEIKIMKIRSLGDELLREENEEFKKILLRAGEQDTLSLKSDLASPGGYLLAYVLAGPATPPYDSLIIDVGTVKGVSVGSIVLDPSGSAIGEIVESFASYSKVKLFSSYGTKLSVYVGTKKTMAEMRGEGSGNFSITLPGEFSIKDGEGAYLPGIGRYIVATVMGTKEVLSDPHKIILLKSVYNARELRTVGVVKAEQKNVE